MASDPNGLLKILEIHGAELHALLARLTLDASVAEDLLQELFLKLRAATGFSQARNPRAYAFRSAIHLAFDWRRGRRSSEPLETEPAAGAALPLERLIDAEELEQVLEAMQQLSELGREVVVLHYLQHEEYPDIALRLGKTEHQVRGLCAKAVAQLRSILRPATSEPERGKP